MAKSVSCTDCERLTGLSERIAQLEKKIDKLHQIAVCIHVAENGQTFIHGITSAVEHPATDLADTLPWTCPNTSGSAVEAN